MADSLSKSISDEEALKAFLLDIECLQPLREWTGNFNLFDVLKITRAEIRHSNMLAWLLDPLGNHGWGDAVLKSFVHYTVRSFYRANEDVFDVLLRDFHTCRVLREWNHIDILAVSEKEKFLLCIENKIDTGEHSGQLARYRSVLEKVYPQYIRKYIYLSPHGDMPSDMEYWCSMSYGEVLSVLESLFEQKTTSPDAAFLIRHYIEIIRRDIVGDERLAKICVEIYAKHQQALDLIFENRPDRVSAITQMCQNWAVDMTRKGELEVILPKCVKTYTRFKTKLMSEILPDAAEAKSGWGTKNHYFYEIVNLGGEELKLQLSFSSQNIPDDLRLICDRINEDFPSPRQKENWQWRIPFATRKIRLEEDISEENVRQFLDSLWSDVRKFEERLQKIWTEKRC